MQGETRGRLPDRTATKNTGTLMCFHSVQKRARVRVRGSSPVSHLARIAFRVRLVLELGLGHSRVLARCENGLDPGKGGGPIR